MFIGSYSIDGEKIIKLLCQIYGLTCESTVRGNHDFKICKSLHITMRLLKNGISIVRVNVSGYETPTVLVEANALDQMCITPSQYKNDYSTALKLKLNSRTYNGQVKEITRLCYNKLAEMLVGHTIKINNSNVDIPDADSFEELKLKLMVS